MPLPPIEEEDTEPNVIGGYTTSRFRLLFAKQQANPAQRPAAETSRNGLTRQAILKTQIEKEIDIYWNTGAPPPKTNPGGTKLMLFH